MRFLLMPEELASWAESARSQFPAFVEVEVSSGGRLELRCGSLRTLRATRVAEQPDA